MKGSNTLYLNTATMIEIVQQWVDREMKNPAEVKSFEHASERQLSGPSFSVTLQPKEPDPTE